MEDLPGTRLLFDDDGTPYPEPKKQIRKQTKTDLSFEQVLEALQTTHTLSTRMICEKLKTYRPWVTKYILPKLDKIYLNSGKHGASRKSFGINWVYAVRTLTASVPWHKIYFPAAAWMGIPHTVKPRFPCGVF